MIWWDSQQTIDALTEALKEYQRFNRLRDDGQAYLWWLGEWALGRTLHKPKREDYGVEP